MSAYSFSIIIPSWNNLPYLQLCIESIRKNSFYPHQIIVHVNEGADGTKEWLQKQHLDYTSSPENIGICKAVNKAATLANHKFLVYMNDDMYALPNWDKALAKAIASCGEELFMFSATMIEPRPTGNKVVINANFGESLEDFEESALLKSDLKKDDWYGSSWPPVLLPKSGWDAVGGFSEEFSPGMYSDPDLAMKLWQQGCRIFKGVGESLVYHFQQKSTGRIVKNNGRIQFLKKWGMTASDFYKYYLNMGNPYQRRLPEPSALTKTLVKIKGRMLNLVK